MCRLCCRDYFENIEFPDFIEVDELASTERGEKGLSSTEQ